MKNTNHKYLCWLAGIRGIGRKKKFALMQAAGEASLFSMVAEDGIFSTEKETGSFSLEAAGDEQDPGLAARLLYTAPEKELRFLWGEAGAKTPGSREEWQALLNARRQEPERIEEELARAGIGFVSALEEGFPEKLREIPDPPFGIYYKGSMPLENEPAAAIIGARLASGYGREQARRFGRQIGARGIAVISGMARGIDGISQKAALDAGGKSYAVLGCGVDICYPEENRELYERLQQEGGVLSEYPPGMQPVAKLFPPRNRIISGLSDLVLVIEARKKSGTLITVDMALEQGREVYALPGRVSDSLSDGCNRLIRQGAGPATCPEDILEYFFGTVDSQDTPSKKKQYSACQQVNTALESAVMKILSREDTMHLERILEALERYSEYDDQREEIPEGISQEKAPGETDFTSAGTGGEASFHISINELISVLMRLKLQGEIEEITSGYYCRAGQS